LRTRLRRRGGFEKAEAMEEKVKMGNLCLRHAGASIEGGKIILSKSGNLLIW